MSINLRWKNNKDGSKTAYLDIYKKGEKRRKKYIGIKINKNDTDKKEKKLKAEAIRTSYHKDILDRKYDLVSEDRMEADFIKYFQLFMDNHKKAGIRKYIYAYQKFLSFLKRRGNISTIQPKTLLIPYSKVSERLPFNQLNYAICQDYKDYLYSDESGLSGETPYDYFKRFKAVVNKAFRERYLLVNPTDNVVVKKPDSNLKKQVLTKEELQILVGAHCGNSEVKRAFLFACFTGLGGKELRLLQWKDIVNGKINTKRAKNEQPIMIKLSETAKELIGEKGPMDKRIFQLPSDAAINSNLKVWMKRAGIEKHITFYSARHTFAILNLRSGTHLKTLSSLMGHTSTIPTNKYLNYLDEEQEEAIDNLPELTL